MSKQLISDNSISEETSPNELLLNDLKLRIEELEISNDTSQYNLGVIKEIISIISEFPAGKTLINRATNRYKLRCLTYITLPRREQALIDLEKNSDMPPEIKKTFMNKESILINKTIRAKIRREAFEEKASKVVGDFLKKLFTLVNKNKSKRLKKIKHATI